MPLTAPTAVVVAAVSATQLNVSWTAPSDVGAGIKTYRVYRNLQMIREVPGSVTSISDTNCVGLTIYAYVIEAIDAVGTKASSTVGVGATPPGSGGYPWSLSGSGGITAIHSPGVGVYLAGFTRNVYAAAEFVLWVAKTDNNGVLQWFKPVRLIPAAGFSSGVITGIDVDSSGNVFVGGWYTGQIDFGDGLVESGAEGPAGNGRQDAFVAKYNASGVLQWKQFRNAADSRELIQQIAVDSAGAVVAVGVERIGFTGDRAFVVKYNASGTLVWDKPITSSADASAWGVATDSANNVWVTGQYLGSVDLGCGPLTSFNPGAPDIFFGKLNGSNGNCMWSKSFGGFYQDTGLDIAIDGSGNGILVGYFSYQTNLGGTNLNTPNATLNTCLGKYDTNGNHLWSRAMNTTGSIRPRRLAVGTDTKIYVAGDFPGGFTTFAGVSRKAADGAGFVAQYGPDGAEQGFFQTSAQRHLDVATINGAALTIYALTVDLAFEW